MNGNPPVHEELLACRITQLKSSSDVFFLGGGGVQQRDNELV